MFTKKFYEEVMTKDTLPEIVNNDPTLFLMNFIKFKKRMIKEDDLMDFPSIHLLRYSINLLKNYQLIVIDGEKYSLSSLGLLTLKFPINITLAIPLLLSTLF